MEAIKLRPFKVADVPAITQIYRHYVENTVVSFDLEAPDEAMIAEKYRGMRAAGHPVIIAEVENSVVGFAYATTYRPRPAYRFTCENSVYLSPEMIGRGLGSVLLKELIKQAQAFGFNQMVAIITAGTKGSMALHSKFDFKTLGIFPELGWKFDKWHDIVHMQLKL